MKSINIKSQSSSPKYQQIIDSLLESVHLKKIKPGQKIPSINDVAREYSIARETVVKAFRNLEEKGIIEAVHGKGFYLKSGQISRTHHLFVLVDTFNAYKLPMLDGIKDVAGVKARTVIYLHHYNFNVFKSYIEEAKGRYTHYIISPWDHDGMMDVISLLPEDQLYLIDRLPPGNDKSYSGVWQDFENNIYDFLISNLKNIQKYKKLIFLFRDATTEPPIMLLEGFRKFQNQHFLPCEIKTTGKITEIKEGEAYIVIDDNDLVDLVLLSRKLNFTLGNQLGLLSYNESNLKKVISDGISTISTDFKKMGEKLGKMILVNNKESYTNEYQFIDRGSF